MIAAVVFLFALFLVHMFARAVSDLPRGVFAANRRGIGLSLLSLGVLAVFAGAVAHAGNGTMTPTAGRGWAYTPPQRPTCSAGLRGYVWLDQGTPDRLLACASSTTAGAPAWRRVTLGTAAIVN